MAQDHCHLSAQGYAVARSLMKSWCVEFGAKPFCWPPTSWRVVLEQSQVLDAAVGERALAFIEGRGLRGAAAGAYAALIGGGAGAGAFQFD